MLVQRLKRIAKESIYCIFKSQSQNSVVQPSKNHYFEIFSPATAMLGPIADSGYERISNTPETSD